MVSIDPEEPTSAATTSYDMYGGGASSVELCPRLTWLKQPLATPRAAARAGLPTCTPRAAAHLRVPVPAFVCDLVGPVLERARAANHAHAGARARQDGALRFPFM